MKSFGGYSLAYGYLGTRFYARPYEAGIGAGVICASTSLKLLPE